MDQVGRLRIHRNRMVLGEVVEWKVLQYLDDEGQMRYIVLGPGALVKSYPHRVPNLYLSRREGDSVVRRHVGPIELDENGKIVKLTFNPGNFTDLINIDVLPKLRKKDGPRTPRG